MSKLTRYIKRGFYYILNGQPKVIVTPKIITLAPNELLQGRLALITGGTSGIGKSIAIAFLSAGANVIITSRSLERALSVASELNNSYPQRSVIGIAMDNTNVLKIKETVDQLASEYKEIDILVNNAGVGEGFWGRTTEDEYDKVMDTNLKGVFFLTEYIARYMKENNIRGNILNICSSASLRPANTAYRLSKWALRGFTEGIAKTLIKYDIVVNGIAPGPTATPLFGYENLDDIAKLENPNGRYAAPEEIANMAVIYVSEMGRTIVGDIAFMTGGAGNLTYDDKQDYSF